MAESESGQQNSRLEFVRRAPALGLFPSKRNIRCSAAGAPRELIQMDISAPGFCKAATTTKTHLVVRRG